jgi:hypothetical protein
MERQISRYLILKIIYDHFIKPQTEGWGSISFLSNNNLQNLYI